MQVRLLGPLDVIVEGEPRQVSGLRRKAVLAALALHGGEVVSADRLFAAVWGDAPPPTAVNTLQSHVSSLRNILGDKDAVLARPPGYVLDLGVDGTDVRAAERLLRQGEQSASPAEAVRHLRDALALWRGQPLADAFCQQALPPLRQSGDQAGEALTWDSIGYAHHNLGSYRQAIADYETALKLARAAGDKGTEAMILGRLGDTLDTTASYNEARDVLRQALAIFDQLGRTEAAEIRAKLDSGRLGQRALLRCRVDVPLSGDLGARSRRVDRGPGGDRCGPHAREALPAREHRCRVRVRNALRRLAGHAELARRPHERLGAVDDHVAQSRVDGVRQLAFHQGGLAGLRVALGLDRRLLVGAQCLEILGG
jgi:hypothetical protein